MRVLENKGCKVKFSTANTGDAIKTEDGCIGLKLDEDTYLKLHPIKAWVGVSGNPDIELLENACFIEDFVMFCSQYGINKGLGE